MADIKPFRCVRPAAELAEKVAALPYDVYNRKEACEAVKNAPLSFLNIDRAETQFGDDVDTYADCVYDKAKELINTWIEEGRLVKQDKPMFYIYQEIMNDRPQTGIVGCASVADYENNIIKKHENTLSAKEADRIRHIDTTNMQTGPIFLAFRSNKEIDAFLAQKTSEKPYYDFVSEDGITHKVWLVDDDSEIESVEGYFAAMNAIYIADGHHRCASACKVSAKRHIEGKVQESDFFMSVLFPENQLKIMDYNRVVKDLNGYDVATFLEELETYCHIGGSDIPVKPAKKGQVGMYLDGQWFSLEFKTEYLSDDPVEGLDVSILQKYVLDGMLDIKDPKNDKRIDFVGGIRGLEELERRVNSDCRVAFAMYPTDINELFDVADASRLMPPKSTWFEPKLRSGLFLHSI